METRIERHGPPVGFGATAHSHGRIAPTKERHQLRDGCPALGIETRRGLPKPMGRPIEADRLAPLAEPMTEGGFVHRPPARASDEVEHFRAPVRSGGQGYRERRDTADGEVGAGLLGPELDDAVLLDVLAPEPRRIANPEARIEQHGIGQALARSFRIGGLERRQVLIRKRRMTGLLTGVRAPRDREPLDPSQGFASKIGLASPVTGSGRVSRVAQANTLETVPSRTFAMGGVARRALRPAWIAVASMSSRSTGPFSEASFSNIATRCFRVAGRNA